MNLSHKLIDSKEKAEFELEDFLKNSKEKEYYLLDLRRNFVTEEILSVVLPRKYFKNLTQLYLVAYFLYLIQFRMQMN